MMPGFDDIRRELPLGETASREGLTVKPWGGGVHFDCPICRKGGRDGSGARARDGVKWRCVRCGAGGDVVDLLAHTRGLDLKRAFREALELAGLSRHSQGPTDGRDAREWRPRRHDEGTSTSPMVIERIDEQDLAARLRAVRLAALHYMHLADIVTDDPDRMSASDHLEALVDLGLRVRPDLEDGLEIARAYLLERLALTWPESREVARELVGICPSSDSGLVEFLRLHGGDGLVDAARRADITKSDGETFAGMLVYFWRDAEGRVVYLTGRAVPRLSRDPKRKLCLRSPLNNVQGFGLFLPEVPFGASIADRFDDRFDHFIAIVEGELDAVQGLVVGPTVATGGTGRMGGPKGVQSIRKWLRERDCFVRFDDESDPKKRAEVAKRSKALASALGCGWFPPDGFDHVEEAGAA